MYSDKFYVFGSAIWYIRIWMMCDPPKKHFPLTLLVSNNAISSCHVFLIYLHLRSLISIYVYIWPSNEAYKKTNKERNKQQVLKQMTWLPAANRLGITWTKIPKNPLLAAPLVGNEGIKSPSDWFRGIIPWYDWPGCLQESLPTQTMHFCRGDPSKLHQITIDLLVWFPLPTGFLNDPWRKHHWQLGDLPTIHPPNDQTGLLRGVGTGTPLLK